MGSVTRIRAVAGTTFRETIRNKVMLHLAGFGAALMALGWVVSNWSLGEPAKIAADIGLSATTLVGCAIALFSGIVLVWSEVEGHTILPVLAKPIARHEFIIGKFCGFSAAVLIVYAGMNLLLIGMLFAIGMPPTAPLVAAIYLSCWEVVLVTALAVAFSSVTTPTLSAIFSVIIFVSGRFSSDIQTYLDADPLAESRSVLETIYAIIPHLGNFNLRLEAVHNLPITADRILFASLYGLGYSTLLVAIAVLAFRNRDLA